MTDESAATEATEPDTCRPVEVDGETVRVRGSGELTEEGQEAFAALVRVAKAKFVAEAPEKVGELQNRLRLAHKARRAKEHQLDDIRRALCDAGFMADDDPYGHADLADVIRQVGEADQADPRTRIHRWADAFLHRGPGYDLTGPHIPRFTARPVTPEVEEEETARAVQAAADSERAAEWMTVHSGPESMPAELQAKLERIRAEVALLCDCCGDSRERMGRIRRELGLDTAGYFRKDGEDL